MRTVLLMFLVAACGSVTANKMDAGGGDAHGGGDGATGDAPPATPVTAIGANDVTQFQAVAQTFTKVPYAAVAYDDLSEWDTSTSTFTPKNAGDYQVCAALYLTNNFNSAVELDLFKNGVREREFAEGLGIASGCRTIRLAANDKLDVRVSQGGQSVTVSPDPNWQWMTISRVTSVSAYDTSAQFNSPSGQFVRIPYAAKVYDDASQFDAANNRFVAGAAGDYQFCTSLTLSTGTLDGEIDMFVNGNRGTAASNGVGYISGCRSMRLGATDAVEARFFQNTMATTIGTSNENWITIDKMPMRVNAGGITAFTTQSHVWIKVPYAAEIFDDKNELSGGTFTASEPGDYQVCAALLTQSTVQEADELDIYKNGAREHGLAFGHFGLSGCRVMRLVAGDTIEVWTYTAGADNLATDANWDWLDVSKLR